MPRMGLEGAELIERVQRRALDVLGQRVFLGGDVDAGIAHDAGHGRVLARRFCLTRSGSAG
jgi:hypothetical protein